MKQKEIETGRNLVFKVDSLRSTLEVRLLDTTLSEIKSYLEDGLDSVDTFRTLRKTVQGLMEQRIIRGRSREVRAIMLEEIEKMKTSAGEEEKSCYARAVHALDMLYDFGVERDVPEGKRHIVNASIGVTVVNEKNGEEVFRSKKYDAQEGARPYPEELRGIREEEFLYMKFNGKTPIEIKKRLDRIRRDYYRYQRAVELQKSGVSAEVIAKEIGVSGATVWRWFSKNSKPYYLPLERRGRAKSTGIDVPAGRSPEFAYLLGVYIGRGQLPRERLFQFTSCDRKVVEKVQSCICNLFSDKPTIHELVFYYGGEEYKEYQIQYCRKNLVRYLQYVTANKSRMPWEHLVAEDEKISFLKGLFDIAGSVSTLSNGNKKYPCIGLHKISYIKSLFDDIRILFGDFVIFPSFFYSKSNSQLVISGRRNIERMMQNDILPDEKRAKLSEISSETKYKNREYTPEEYYAVKKYYEMHPEALWTEIARATRVPVRQVRDWLLYDKKPLLVKLYEEIASIEQTKPDKDVIGFMYRELGSSSVVARIVARRHIMEEVKEMHQYLCDKGLNPQHHPYLLAYGFDELIAKLGDCAHYALQ